MSEHPERPASTPLTTDIGQLTQIIPPMPLPSDTPTTPIHKESTTPDQLFIARQFPWSRYLEREGSIPVVAADDVAGLKDEPLSLALCTEPHRDSLNMRELRLPVTLSDGRDAVAVRSLIAGQVITAYITKGSNGEQVEFVELPLKPKGLIEVRSPQAESSGYPLGFSPQPADNLNPAPHRSFRLTSLPPTKIDNLTTPREHAAITTILQQLQSGMATISEPQIKGSTHFSSIGESHAEFEVTLRAGMNSDFSTRRDSHHGRHDFLDTVGAGAINHYLKLHPALKEQAISQVKEDIERYARNFFSPLMKPETFKDRLFNFFAASQELSRRTVLDKRDSGEMAFEPLGERKVSGLYKFPITDEQRQTLAEEGADCLVIGNDLFFHVSIGEGTRIMFMKNPEKWKSRVEIEQVLAGDPEELSNIDHSADPEAIRRLFEVRFEGVLTVTPTHFPVTNYDHREGITFEDILSAARNQGDFVPGANL